MRTILRRLMNQRQTVILRSSWNIGLYHNRLVIYGAMPDGRRCPCHSCRDVFYGLQPMTVEVEA